MKLLSATFPEKWIGRGCSTLWTPGSSDLTQPELSLLGVLCKDILLYDQNLRPEPFQFISIFCSLYAESRASRPVSQHSVDTGNFIMDEHSINTPAAYYS
jgi:hypothetical protein